MTGGKFTGGGFVGAVCGCVALDSTFVPTMMSDGTTGAGAVGGALAGFGVDLVTHPKHGGVLGQSRGHGL